MSPQAETTDTKDTFIVVMPALNEEAYIENTIDSWAPVVSGLAGSEIIIIEGGSSDGTKDELDKLSRKYDFLNVVDQGGKGHGNALMQGYKNAIESHHHWVFQTDADGHFKPEDFYKLWEKRGDSEFLLGYREERKDPFHRLLVTRLISLWIRLLFGHDIKDPNIPFRLMRRVHLKDIITKVPENSFAPNILLSILAIKHGNDLHHIPISHLPRKRSLYHSYRLLKGGLRGFIELTKFSFNSSR
jgi:glycosyltransferase involved in cell wall biosynthesis